MFDLWYSNDWFRDDLLLCCRYVPNSGEGLKRLDYRVGEWDVKFSEYLKALEARGKPVIVTGKEKNCSVLRKKDFCLVVALIYH